MPNLLRNSLIFSFVLVAAFCSAQASAATTYTLTPVTYTSTHGNYSSATGMTGSFTTANPLPPNLTNARIANGTGGLGYVTSWSFNDGVFVYTNANSGPLGNNGYYFNVSTDASGAIVGSIIYLVSPPLFTTPSDPIYRLGLTALPGNNSVDAGIFTCPSGTAGNPCPTYYADAANSFALSTATPQFLSSAAPPPAQPTIAAPALSRWSLLALATTLAALAAMMFRAWPRNRERTKIG